MISTDKSVVHVVDDDEAVRKSLHRSLGKRGYRVETYASADAFLAGYDASVPGCLVLDVRMPGTSGLDLQEKLIAANIPLPIIFVTGHGDIPMSVRAMKGGAVDFLEKPYPVETLVLRIEEAIKKSLSSQESSRHDAEIKKRFEQLTPRERDVMILLVAGAADTTNKVIARQLSISHRTVDEHRSKIMGKMQARSLPDLVDMAKNCGVYQSDVPHSNDVD